MLTFFPLFDFINKDNTLRKEMADMDSKAGTRNTVEVLLIHQSIILLPNLLEMEVQIRTQGSQKTDHGGRPVSCIQYYYENSIQYG